MTISGVGIYRSAGGQSVWLYHDTTEVKLRANGEALATFDSPADVISVADDGLLVIKNDEKVPIDEFTRNIHK